MILTARKVFLILVFAFNLIHLPFITAMFSFLVVWSVLGKGWAIIIFVITSIPDWVSSLYQAIFLANPTIALAQSLPQIAPSFPIPSWALIVITPLYIIVVIGMVFKSVQRIIRIKNRIRKTVSGLYGFEPFRRSEDSNP